MILSNIKQFLGRNKKIFSYITFFFIASFLFGDVTFATDENAKKIASFFSELLKGVSVLLGLMTYLATLFLSPEWINGSLFGMNEKFKEVWIMVSNVVYFVFAFILIWIAFMNIIGKEGDQYQLKQALPKFIVGVLIVPFSWFLVQFILSVSAILTISALTLPMDSFPDYKSKLSEVMVPNKCVIDVTSLGTKTEGTEGSKGEIIDCSGGAEVPLTEVMSGNATSSIYGIISMYTYGIIGFDNVDNLFGEDAKVVKTMGDIVVKIVFDVLFVLIYAILIIALGLVLMIRGIYIWIYTMMSPIFGLMYFFDKKDGGGEGFFGKFNLKEFIALAMVPVYTMLALSFGLLFMYVVGSGLSGMNGGEEIAGQTVKIQKSTEGNDGIQIGEFRLELKGALASQSKDATGLLKSFGGQGLGVVGGLILKLFGIVVLWGTVMAAMRSSDVTKAIVEPLHSFGSKVGGIMTSAPGNIPIFGGMSAKGLDQVGTTAGSHYSEKSRKTGTDFVSKHGMFGGNVKTAASSATAKDYSKGNSAGGKVAMEKLSNAIHDFKKVEDMKSGNGDIIEAIKNNSKALGVDENLYKNLTTSSNPKDIAKAIYALDAKSEISKMGSIIKGDFTGGKHQTETLQTLNGLLAEGSDSTRSSTLKNNSNEIKDSSSEQVNGKTDIVRIQIDGSNIGDFKSEGGNVSEIKDNMVEKISNLIVNKGLRDDGIEKIIGTIGFTDKAKKDLKDKLLGKVYYNEENKSYSLTDPKDGKYEHPKDSIK